MLLGLVIVLISTPTVAQVLVLDDPLLSSSLGTVGGGTFLSDGWRVSNQYDSIYWHIPTVSHGAAEWSVRGLVPNESRGAMSDKTELFHMYDHTFNNADTNYGGYRDNPYKHFVRKIGSLDGPPKTDALELVWQVSPDYEEPDTAALSWNVNTTYRFREEWGPDGSGNAVLRTYRDGALLRTTTISGTWNPTGHSVRIGAANPPGTRSAPIDAVFSNLKVWDLSSNDALPPLPQPRTGDVALSGHAIIDAGGEFTGLGASYFQALRRTKYDRAGYRSDLDFLARNGFDYIRTLSMVGGNSAWSGKEIAPISFVNDQGQTIPAWSDYWQQFRDMIDIAYDEFGIRTQITVFADAQFGMPNEADRIALIQNVLTNIQGREHKVIMLEVANEYWQNGFPNPGGVSKVRQFGKYLADRTDVLVALSSTNGTNTTLEQMYQYSAADVATEHFSRDIGTGEGGWLPVRDPWRVNSAQGIPPVISNEPIGPGSSVNSENDPIKLVSAAAFAWMAGLPAYVFHSSAGVFGNARFQDMAGVASFRHVQDILPGNIANWQRSDGKDALSPFITYANGQANKWWTEVSNPNSGAVRNIANVKGNEFYALPIGIQANGVELQARRDMTMQVFNPLNGEVVREFTPSANQRFTLAQGPQAYIIRGSYADDGPARINLDAVNDPHGLVHPQGGDGDTIAAAISGRDARRNANPSEDFYFYFAVADWFTGEGNHADLYITVEYFDDGNGSLALQYDSNTGTTLPAFYKNGGNILLNDSETWKTHTFHITDAYFGNRQNGNSDFRIAGGVGKMFYLDSVSVATVPEPSAICLLAVGGVCLLVPIGRRFGKASIVRARVWFWCLGALIVPTTSSAGEVGSPFVVASGGARFPDVAYNSVDGTYLAVWVDYSVQSAPVVRGRRVSNTGSAIGNAFRISEVATGGAYYPSVAYNATDNEFMVSFDTDPSIYGQRVRGSDGALIGGNFGIGVVDAGRSSVDWSPFSNNYLVAYWAFPGGPTEIYGRRLTNTGGLIGNEFNISNDNSFSGYPSVAWGATGNQFLVAWDHEPADNLGYIRGQRLSASNGSLLDGPFNIATSGTDNRSNIAYDSIRNRWFVQYNQINPGASFDQFGTLVNPDGSLASNSLPIANTAGFEGDTLLGGDIAFTPGFDGRYFSVFEREFGTLNGSTGQESSAAGSRIGPQMSLSSSGAGSIAVAADTNLHRFLTVWDGGASGVVQGNLFTSKPIPEPSTVWLMTLGGFVLWLTSVRRRR